MNREVHVRFWESAGVRFHCATHLPTRLRDRKRRPRRDWPPHQLLQHPPATLEPSGPNSGRGVPRIAASASSRRSLTSQSPLKKLQDLFRSMGPALLAIRRSDRSVLVLELKLRRSRRSVKVTVDTPAQPTRSICRRSRNEGSALATMAHVHRLQASDIWRALADQGRRHLLDCPRCGRRACACPSRRPLGRRSGRVADAG